MKVEQIDGGTEMEDGGWKDKEWQTKTWNQSDEGWRDGGMKTERGIENGRLRMDEQRIEG